MGEEYYCAACDYRTTRKSSYSKHLTSMKHHNAVKKSTIAPKIPVKVKPPPVEAEKFVCSICDLTFKNRMSLYRHKKKCEESMTETKKMDDIEENVVVNDKKMEDIVDKMVDENKSLRETMSTIASAVTTMGKSVTELAESQKAIVENAMVTNNNINTTNNINNTVNNFNLQVYLNQDCKNAMNLTDFVASLKCRIEDLERFGKAGYVEGVSKLLIDGLNALDENSRPIHCTDTKRDSLYIKDNDEWQKDVGKTGIKKAIKNVAHKNFMKIPEWQAQHPRFHDPASNTHRKYMKMVDEVSGGKDEDEDDKNFKKIIKRVALETTIDKVDK